MHQPLRQRVAEEVRVAFARKRVSVNAASKALGWSQPYLSRRVNGQIPFNVDDLEAIATWLGIPTSQLLGLPDASGVHRSATGTDTGAHTDWYPDLAGSARGREAQVIPFPVRYDTVSASGPETHGATARVAP